MKHSFKQTQRGFTLLELVVVIAVTGVLLVVAMPKILGTSADARVVSVNKVAEQLGTAGAQNFVLRTVDATKGAAIGNCTDTYNALQSQSMPSGYTITTGVVSTSTVNGSGTMGSQTCTVTTTSTPAITATFAAYKI